jgi:hypothetical protein
MLLRSVQGLNGSATFMSACAGSHLADAAVADDCPIGEARMRDLTSPPADGDLLERVQCSSAMGANA